MRVANDRPANAGAADARLLNARCSVVVAVAPVRVVQVPAYQVVGVPGMRNRFVAASGSVRVLRVVLAAHVFRGAAVRMSRIVGQFVAVHVIAVHVMQVAFMQIIGVPVVLHLRVPAVCAVRMNMSIVGFASHEILLAWTFMVTRFRQRVCVELCLCRCTGLWPWSKPHTLLAHRCALIRCNRAASCAGRCFGAPRLARLLSVTHQSDRPVQPEGE